MLDIVSSVLLPFTSGDVSMFFVPISIAVVFLVVDFAFRLFRVGSRG